jgi:hypothetical protein
MSNFIEVGKGEPVAHLAPLTKPKKGWRRWDGIPRFYKRGPKGYIIG